MTDLGPTEDYDNSNNNNHPDDDITPILAEPGPSTMGKKGFGEELEQQDSKPSPGDAEVLAEAIENENSLSFLEAARLYPAAVFWSAFVSIGVIMLAFDPQLLGNLYAMPQFQRDFGYEYNGEVCGPCTVLVYLPPNMR